MIVSIIDQLLQLYWDPMIYLWLFGRVFLSRLPWFWFWFWFRLVWPGLEHLGQWETLRLQDVENKTRLRLCVFSAGEASWVTAAEAEQAKQRDENELKWEEITFLDLNLTLEHRGHVPAAAAAAASSTGSDPEADLNFNLFPHSVSDEATALNFWAQTAGGKQSRRGSDRKLTHTLIFWGLGLSK